MRRRDFIKVVSGSAITWPFAAWAENPKKLPTIGLMPSGTISSHGQFTQVFVQRLRDLGWSEGHTIEIIYRWGEGRPERFAALSAEFVKLNVDIIVTTSVPAVLAAKQATSKIPIIFPTVSDPVAAGLVASLAHPGGNVTGLGFQTVETASKRVQLLQQVIPNLRRLGILGISDEPSNAAELHQAQIAADALGFETKTIVIRQNDEIARLFNGFKGDVDAVYIATSPVFMAHPGVLATSAIGARLPTMHSFRVYVDAGGLMSYGANFPDLWRRAADMVDKVLHGATPANIPVEQPTKFELVINLTIARTLGLTIPASLLSLADELVE